MPLQIDPKTGYPVNICLTCGENMSLSSVWGSIGMGEDDYEMAEYTCPSCGHENALKILVGVETSGSKNGRKHRHKARR